MLLYRYRRFHRGACAPGVHVGQASVITGPICPQDIGKNIYTIREVVREIRDKATRRRLAVLPYELRFREPFPEYVRLGECPGPALGTAAQSGDRRAPGPARARFRNSRFSLALSVKCEY